MPSCSSVTFSGAFGSASAAMAVDNCLAAKLLATGNAELLRTSSPLLLPSSTVPVHACFCSKAADYRKAARSTDLHDAASGRFTGTTIVRVLMLELLVQASMPVCCSRRHAKGQSRASQPSLGTD